MFQNVLMDPMISKEKQISSFFQCLLESLCPFQKKIGIVFCVFSMSNTCLHVISYKCKHVLFHFEYVEIISKDNLK